MRTDKYGRHGLVCKVRNILITGLFIMILAVMGFAPQMAGMLPGGAGADAAYADGTTYTIFIYSGKEGYFGEPGNTVKKITGKAYGKEVTVDLTDLDLKVKDPDEYYVRGLKIAGHDNDELSSLQFQSYTFNIEEDTAFSVSYGMAGGMVKYTVNYRDKSGKTLADSQVFYGMAGDRPVVACKRIEGYLPDDQNLTKMLSSNEADNVFTFTYHKAEGVAGGTTEEEDTDDDGAANGGNAANNAARNAGGTATANAGTNVPGTNITNLDDNNPPLADAGQNGSDKDKSSISGATMGLIGIVIAGILIALGLLYLILRRRGEEEE